MKRLSFRFVRRLMLLLALVFPVVYLMGGFVAALAGSHGNVTLAQDEEVVTSSEIVDFNQRIKYGDFDNNGTWSSVMGTLTSSNNIGTYTVSTVGTISQNRISENLGIIPAGHKLFVTITIKPVSRAYQFCFLSYNSTLSDTETYLEFNTVAVNTKSVQSFVFTNNRYGALDARFGFGSSAKAVGDKIEVSNIMVTDLTQMYGVGNEPTADVFRARYDADYYDYTLSTQLIEESTDIPTYSEFLFNQILGSDNIIKQWGYYALSEENKGFAPFASLIQIVDDNFFHLGDSNDLGLFVYGYVYYALNIVAIYELVALVVMVFTIPLKLTDRFTKEM